MSVLKYIYQKKLDKVFLQYTQRFYNYFTSDFE
jgi:hypothetical protein